MVKLNESKLLRSKIGGDVKAGLVRLTYSLETSYVKLL